MFDHAQSPRLGQRVAPENPGIRIFDGEEIPEVAYNGEMIYRSDRQVIQVYDETYEAWEDAVGGLANQLTFIQSTPPTARSVGDIWYDTSVTPRVMKSWDGDSWELGSTGFSQASVIHNSNMEEPLVQGGVVESDHFAGWVGYDGTWDWVSQETASPISGTRSMKIALPTATSTKRMISAVPVPVLPGQSWRISAQIKLNRTVDTSTSADVAAILTAHTSDGSVSPSAAHNVTTVVWQNVNALNAFSANTVVILEGDIVIPSTHTLMQVSLYSGQSNDGSGYTATWDEVNALSTNSQLSIINNLGEVTASISSDGDASFHDVSYTGTFQAEPESFMYGGQPLSELIASLPHGRLARLERTFTSPLPTTTTELAMYKMDVQLSSDRSVDFAFRGTFESPDTTDMRYNIRCRYEYSATANPGSSATTSSTSLFTIEGSTVGIAGQNSGNALVVSKNLDAGFYRFVFTEEGIGSGNTIQAIGTHDVTITDQGPSFEENRGYWSADAGGSSQNAEPQSFTKTYNCLNGRWWAENSLTSYSGIDDNLLFGNSANQPSNGNRRLALWFNEDSIRADLSGSTVTKVELYLYKYIGGSDTIVKVGTHTDPAPDDNWNNITGKTYNLFTSTPWANNSGRWLDLNFSLQDWKTTLAGIVIYPSGLNTDQYSGGIKGPAHSLKPQLRITYTK
jgi:hypothetical protein